MSVKRQVLFLFTACTLIVMVTPVQADPPTAPVQPVALVAATTEGGIQLDWVDTGVATAYQIERTARDGTVHVFSLPGDQSSFLDGSVTPGSYTYTLIAERLTPDQSTSESNPVPVLAWPSCLPWISLNPAGVYWHHGCYCPMNDSFRPVEALICP